MTKMDVSKMQAPSRRQFLAGAGALGAAALVTGCSDGPAATPTPVTTPVTDVDILNFALNLEYLEAEFYLRAATGTGLQGTDAGSSPGAVTGGTQVTFTSPVVQQYAVEIAQNELNHVRFLQKAIAGAGGTAVGRPAIDFSAFAAAATAANISGGASFNAFADQTSFLLGAFVFEDVGVTAYTGAATLLSSKTILSAAAGIQAVEAYHAAEIRTLIANIGGTALTNANLLSQLRASLGGGNETTLSISSIVAADATNAIAFSRTTDQVLHIVYAQPAGVRTKGGFFPNGLNGKITATAA